MEFLLAIAITVAIVFGISKIIFPEKKKAAVNSMDVPTVEAPTTASDESIVAYRIIQIPYKTRLNKSLTILGISLALAFILWALQYKNNHSEAWYFGLIFLIPGGWFAWKSWTKTESDESEGTWGSRGSDAEQLRKGMLVRFCQGTFVVLIWALIWAPVKQVSDPDRSGIWFSVLAMIFVYAGFRLGYKGQRNHLTIDLQSQTLLYRH